MNIGIFFTTQKNNGGEYQYALAIAESLVLNKENNYFIFCTSCDFDYKKFSSSNIKIFNLEKNAKLSKLSVYKKIVYKFLTALYYLKLNFLINYFFKKKDLIQNSDFIKLVKDKKIDLMFFTSPSSAVSLLNIPSVVPIHDLQHRLNKKFKEVSQNGEWIKREYLYSQITKYAYKILVDSDIGKEDVLKFYSVDKNKIKVLPFLPPNYLKKNISDNEIKSLIKKYRLPLKFLFYPAQFWPHKNHINIVNAMKILKNENIIINLVLCGGKKKEWGEYCKVVKFVKENNLEKQFFYLGYINSNEVSFFYKLATALIMPTFFGPTNIPILEAWQMKCPVVYSNIRGCSEQAGDAALLVDPSNPKDIADKIKIIWSDKKLQKQLIKKGKEKSNKWTYKNFNKEINKIIYYLKINGR